MKNGFWTNPSDNHLAILLRFKKICGYLRNLRIRLYLNRSIAPGNSLEEILPAPGKVPCA